MSEDSDFEAAVRDCYSTWSGNYYDEYYGERAPYPPVHRDLLKRLLHESGARRVLDAGCGPASFLRELADEPYELAGFDLTPEMVAEAQRVLGGRGDVWQGSVLDRNAFLRGAPYDAAICVGVLPHVPPEADDVVIANLREAVKPGGLVVLEARNQLFALFTLNRYTRDLFVGELIDDEHLRALAAKELDAILRVDLPPVRTGKADEPGYDEVLSRTHNPLALGDRMAASGFADVRTLYYHFHAAPPLVEARDPEAFRRASLAMENADDWRGLVTASAFVLAGRRA